MRSFSDQCPKNRANTPLFRGHIFSAQPLTTCSTIDERKRRNAENRITGYSAVGSAGGLGPSGRGFKSLYSDQKIEITPISWTECRIYGGSSIRLCRCLLWWSLYRFTIHNAIQSRIEILLSKICM